ncbi:hypothetical protein BYT27DRAFT_7183254 [Phlegmacium glaucopus]|nr:hypothetical protein BYT27DRAFT_7183254 [Phlegmacium glaucopus]
MFFPKFYCMVLCIIALVSYGRVSAENPTRGAAFLGGVVGKEPTREHLKNDHDK